MSQFFNSRGARIGILNLRKDSGRRWSLERAGAGLERIVVGALRRTESGQAAVLAWPVACGSAVAARTTALQFSEGVLRVEVPDTGWRKELQGLAPQYVAVLNRYVGQTVRRIEFVIAGQAAPDSHSRTGMRRTGMSAPHQNPTSSR